MPGNYGDDGSQDYFSPENLSHVNISIIDTMVYRILLQMITVTGKYFDQPVCNNLGQSGNCDELLYEKVATNSEHVSLAREIASSSAVLLKNERSILPLKTLPSGSVISLIGSACNEYYNVSGMTVCLEKK
jgi:beta-glucosidase-like glycosyl hydrolase